MTTQIQLPRSDQAPGLARRHIAAEHGDHLGESAAVNAAVVVSELVTNAVVHGRGRILLETGLVDGRLRIEVVDEGTGVAPAIREQPDDGVGGWGLQIVDTLAAGWGAYEGSTHVWAELPLD